MIDIETYRKNARDNDLCESYSRRWDLCKSNKDLMDMALGAKGVDYLCDTIAKGWGVSPDVISKRFRPFINGKYVSKQKGYTSEMYCEYAGDITASTDVLAIISCVVNIDIPANMMCEIYVVGESHLTLSGKGRCAIVCYGEEDSIRIGGSCGQMRRINKKNRDEHGD